MKAILLIDHGSRRDAANEMMNCMANLVQAMAGPGVVVRYAHMELAEPSISAGVRSCVDAGATELIVFPYMLSPGKHSTGDIPRMVSEAAAAYPALAVRVTTAFGVHEKLAELILGRAGLDVAHPLAADEATRCWHASQSETACGDACRCRPVGLSSGTSDAIDVSSRTSEAVDVSSRISEAVDVSSRISEAVNVSSRISEAVNVSSRTSEASVGI